MKKTVFYFLFLLFLLPYRMTAQQEGVSPLKNYSKHEIGLSWGAFPTSGVMYGIPFWDPGSQWVYTRTPFLSLVYPLFAHRDSKEWEGPYMLDETGMPYKETEYYMMQHYGTLTLNYQYHFTKKHSIGFSTTWLGRHISNYTRRPHTNELINAKGWEHMLSFCANYRYTYYSHNALSLYTGIYFGLSLKLIERKLLFKTERGFFVAPGLQITGFGIEAGKTHAFMGELGFGVQGLVKVGYRYKFGE